MITVRELIIQLSKLPNDARVFLQQDAEGNGYRSAVGADVAYKDKHDPFEHKSDHIFNENELEDECITDPERVVVIWPV